MLPSCQLCRYDLDLSTSPYKALRYHTYAVRGAAFHSTYPLFASSSDDGTAHVFHGRVFADLMTNPLVVPVKILRGHKVVDSAGVLDCCFHPTQPWLFTAGADGDVLLFCN
jgi:ribosome biogenesis protein ERB1